MANWRRYHNLNGDYVYLNLGLAIEIRSDGAGHTWISFPDGEGLHSVLVSEPPDTVFDEAEHSNS